MKIKNKNMKIQYFWKHFFWWGEEQRQTTGIGQGNTKERINPQSQTQTTNIITGSLVIFKFPLAAQFGHGAY